MRTLSGRWHKAAPVLRGILSDVDGGGVLIPLLDIVHNPTYDWMRTVDAWYGSQEPHEPPRYGGVEIEAVLLLGDTEVSKPGTQVAILYPPIPLDKKDVVLQVIETEDGRAWELMTDHESTISRPSRTENRHDNHIERRRAVKECRDLGCPNVQMLLLLCTLSPYDLAMHEDRLPLKKKR